MKKQWLFALIAFGIIALLGIIFPFSFDTGDTSGLDKGDVAWMLASTALVFLMTPGLGFFMGEWSNLKTSSPPFFRVLLPWD